MPGIAQLSLTFLNAVTCGAIGAVVYKLLYQNDNRLNEKIREIKVENERLHIKIWSLERVNDDWEMAWLDQFNEKRESRKCPE